jgi:hypothetical protein
MRKVCGWKTDRNSDLWHMQLVLYQQQRIYVLMNGFFWKLEYMQWISVKFGLLLADNTCISFCSVVVITFALHAKGPWFETGRKQSSLTHAVSCVFIKEMSCFHKYLILEIQIHALTIRKLSLLLAGISSRSFCSVAVITCT